MTSLPYHYLSKVGLYDVCVNGVNVKARVADNPSVVELGLSELRPRIRTPNVVGIAVMSSFKLRKVAVLMLCAGSNCLVVQLHRMSSVPQCLKTFLARPDYCFVSANNSPGFGRTTMLKNDYGIDMAYVIEVAELAAKILKTPSIRHSSTLRVGDAVGLPREKFRYLVPVNAESDVFSQEQMFRLVREVHTAYLAGKKLLESL